MLWQNMTGRPSLIARWLGGPAEREKTPRNEILYPSPAKVQSDQIAALSRQVEAEKYRNAQLILLNELSQQLETLLDQPVAAQLAANTLERAMDCSYVCLLIHEPERQEFVALAAAGKMAKLIPAGYRQHVTRGMIGRVTRLRKTQISNDTRLDPDFFDLVNEKNLSSVVVPIIHNGYIEGIIIVNSEVGDAFHSTDVALIEAVAAELERAWERSSSINI
jgi:GAF domain-containing protein